MTRDQFSGSVTATRPLDRGGNACAAKATDGAAQVPSSQSPAVTIARKLVWCRRRLPVALPIVPKAHQPRMPRDSIPIALATERTV
jgi:hypothetical protein